MKIAAFVTALILGTVPMFGLAEPASEGQMAEEAIYLPKDPARRQQRLEEFRDLLYRLVQESPDSIRPAAVYFSRGLTTMQLQLLMEEHQLEVIDANLKAPQGNNGVVMSIGLGYSDVLASDGDLSDRLSYVIDAHQACFAKSARYLPAGEALDKEGLSTVTFLVYSASVFGPATALQQLQDSSVVTSVMLNLREGLIDEFQKQKKVKGPNIYNMPGFLC